MAWVLLLVAGVFEILWPIGMKFSEGFTRLWPTVGTIAASIVSFVLLARATATLPMSTCYLVWIGIGTAGVVVAGMVLFKEPASVLRLVFVALIVTGVVGLKVTMPNTDQPATVVEDQP